MIKKIIVILSLSLVALTSAKVYSQDNTSKTEPPKISYAQPNQPTGEKIAFTIGVLQGGGSLIGADLEFLVNKTLGLQVGAGFVGYGAAVNFHFKPTVRSSFISLNYWHQGIGQSFTQSVLGGTFVYRAKKIFTAQLGMGYRVGEGPAMIDELRSQKFMLLYSIGIYFPLDSK